MAKSSSSPSSSSGTEQERSTRRGSDISENSASVTADTSVISEDCVDCEDPCMVLSESDLDQLVEEEIKWEEEERRKSKQNVVSESLAAPGTTSYSLASLYGSPNSSKKEIAEIIGKLPIAGRLSDDQDDVEVQDRRAEYHLRLIPDDLETQDRLIRSGAVDEKSIFASSKVEGKREIKPRRGPLPAAFASDFMKSIVVIESPNPNKEGSTKQRWIFSGVLNGWPGLKTLEVVSVTCRKFDRITNMLEKTDKTNFLKKQVNKHRLVRLWHTDKEGSQGIPPPHIQSHTFRSRDADSAKEVRVTLRAPAYTINGYNLNNPGFLFWYEASHRKGTNDSCTEYTFDDRILLGQDVVSTMERENEERGKGDGRSKCTRVHLVSHRYAPGTDRRETAREVLTYHSIVVLEWDHGRYVTVVEAAFLHGLGGYAGKSNWYPDKSEPTTKMYKVMPPCMILPWRTDAMELRCFDLPHCKDIHEFKKFVEKFSGECERFVDATHTFSNNCRLTFRSKIHVAQYLCNYIRRNPGYSELSRNCQTFAADFYAFMAGKKDIQPFHPINRIDYKNRVHTFLYDPNMFI